MNYEASSQEGVSREAANHSSSGEIAQPRVLKSGSRVRRMSLNIDEEMHKALRREALEADESLTSYVTRLLQQR